MKNTLNRDKSLVENTRFSHWVGMSPPRRTDYSPFGVLLPERTSSTAFYRRGFQGQEHDDEVKGEGNSVNFKYRMHDPRVGRFFAVDPLASKYPHNSPYAFSENVVIHMVELEGLEMHMAPLPNGGHYVQEPTAPNYKQDTKDLNHKNYKAIHERNLYYKWASKQLGVHGGKWFEAADIVTSLGGVGGADFVNLQFIHNDTENFLKAGNRYLFSFNMFNAKHLMEKGKLDRSFTTADGKEASFKGLKGKDLDMMLVEYEQTKVQEFIGLYEKNHKDLDAVYKEVNKSFGLPMAHKDIQTVLKNHFTDTNGNITFDFKQYDDRVKLGKELIELIYKRDSSPSNRSGGAGSGKH